MGQTKTTTIQIVPVAALSIDFNHLTLFMKLMGIASGNVVDGKNIQRRKPDILDLDNDKESMI